MKDIETKTLKKSKNYIDRRLLSNVCEAKSQINGGLKEKLFQKQNKR